MPKIAGIQPTVSDAIGFTAEPNIMPPKPEIRYNMNIGMNLILVPQFIKPTRSKKKEQFTYCKKSAVKNKDTNGLHS